MMTGHNAQLNTAELTALLHALTIANATTEGAEVIIFTDCLTNMYNLMAMLKTPQKSVGHEHDALISKAIIALRKAAREGRLVTILEARAQSGLAGNELADTTAKDSRGAEVILAKGNGTPG